MKKIIGLFVAAALAFGVVGCANDDGVISNSLVPSSKSVTVVAGKTASITGTTVKGDSVTLTGAESADASCASASAANGTVTITGVRAGSTTVTSTYTNEVGETVSGTTKVKVQFPEGSDKGSSKSEVNCNRYVYVSDWSNVTVSSSNLDVATVTLDSEGKLTITSYACGSSVLSFSVPSDTDGEDPTTFSYEVTIDESGEILSFKSIVAYVLDPSKVEAIAKNKEGKYTTDGFTFTISSSKANPDTQNKVSVINMGGGVLKGGDGIANLTKNYIKIKPDEGVSLSISVSYFNSAAGRYATVVDSEGNGLTSEGKTFLYVTEKKNDDVTDAQKTTSDNAIKTRTFTIDEASGDEYYIGSYGSGLYISNVTVTIKK